MGWESPALQETLSQGENSWEPGMAATFPPGWQVKPSPRKAGREQGPGCASWTQGSPSTGLRQVMETELRHRDRHRAPFPSHSSTISLKVMSGLDTGTNILLLLQPFGCHKKLPATFPQSGCNFFSWLEIGAVIKVSSCLPIWRLSSPGNLLGVKNYTEIALLSNNDIYSKIQ